MTQSSPLRGFQSRRAGHSNQIIMKRLREMERSTLTACSMVQEGGVQGGLICWRTQQGPRRWCTLNSERSLNLYWTGTDSP